MAKKNDKSSTPVAPPIADVEGKLKALEATLGRLQKQFGTGSIMNMGASAVEEVSVIPTGSLALDHALGVGGYPRGRIIEIFGPESSGKTTLAIHAIAEAQKLGGLAAIIDAEHAFDPTYATKLGVDINRLWISQPDNGEQALEIAEQLIRSSAVDLIIIDSVAALTPKAEIDGDMTDQSVGLHARLMSRALRKITAAVSRSKTCCIFINQLRQKIGGYGPNPNPETTTGGNALKFYSTIRLDIRRTTSLLVNQEPIGNHTRVKVAKNKVAPPFQQAFFDIVFGEGIYKIGETIDFAVEMGIIKKNGSYFYYNGEKLGQGRDTQVKKLFEDNPEFFEEIRSQVIARLGTQAQVAPPDMTGESPYEEDLDDTDLMVEEDFDL